jgi:hypothetical protein
MEKRQRSCLESFISCQSDSDKIEQPVQGELTVVGPHNATIVCAAHGILNNSSRAGAGNFSLNHRVQNGSGAHPTSYPMSTRGSFPGGKAAGA